MKTRYGIILASALFTTTALTPAQANDTVVGAVVGGGIGALIGKSVGGRNGAAVGGAIGAVTGALVGSENSDRWRTQYEYGAPAPVYYDSYDAPRPVYYSGRDYAPPPRYYPEQVYAPPVVAVRPPPSYIVYDASPRRGWASPPPYYHDRGRYARERDRGWERQDRWEYQGRWR